MVLFDTQKITKIANKGNSAGWQIVGDVGDKIAGHSGQK